jgi:hypothetical protein
MFRRSTLFAALAGAWLAFPAVAEETVMHEAIAAGSLHEGPLDMVAYWQPAADGTLVVTATFLEREAPEAEPMRIVMALAEGDAVAFAMPGFLDALYRFSRDGGAVTASVGAPARPRRIMAGL